jgi:predicted O-linked N-acetylglucosamine transferase (SPINDLY family)
LKFSNDIIRIGFISGDFKEHAVTFQLGGIFEALNLKKNIEIYAYSNNLKDDNLTKKITNNFKSFKIIHSISDEDLAKLINSENIDVLIDLSGHTTANRLTVFKYKPAKICITWAGYLASTQLPNIDYIIADKFTIPLHEEKNYSEKIIRLSSWSTLSEIQNNIEVPLESPCSYNNYITFGSINNISKINYEVIELWSKILLNIPNSKLLIKNHQLDSLDIREIIKQKFSKFNVNEKKIILRGSSSREDLLKTYNEIDIALDPFPYGGGTTSLESAWMCVPILTISGNSFVSRGATSVNLSLGMPDWNCKNKIEYLEKAINFSSDIDLLSEIKSQLIKKRKTINIFDNVSYAKKFYFMMSNIWNKYLEQNI